MNKGVAAPRPKARCGTSRASVRSLRPALRFCRFPTAGKWRMKKRSRIEERRTGREKPLLYHARRSPREEAISVEGDGRRTVEWRMKKETGEDNGARTEDGYSFSQRLISIVSLFQSGVCPLVFHIVETLANASVSSKPHPRRFIIAKVSPRFGSF
jgi:hypothetical protein